MLTSSLYRSLVHFKVFLYPQKGIFYLACPIRFDVMRYYKLAWSLHEPYVVVTSVSTHNWTGVSIAPLSHP